MQGCEPAFSTCFAFSDAFFPCRGMARAPQNPPAQARRDGAPLECRREGSRRAQRGPRRVPSGWWGYQSDRLVMAGGEGTAEQSEG